MNQEKSVRDRELLEQALAGNGHSFGELFERHRDRVFRHTFSILSDATAAEDVTAMVFYEAWRKRPTIRIVDESIIAWLLVTANFTIRNHTRQQRRYRKFLSQLPEPERGNDLAQDVVDQQHAEDEGQLIRAAFQMLNAQARDILTLCVIEQLSIQQAACIIGVPEGTIKSRLSRAKSKLGQFYSDAVTSTVPSLSERCLP